MIRFFEKLLSGARAYSLFDFGMLKFALLFIGMLLGVYFHELFSQHLCLIWTLALLCYGYIVYVTFSKAYRKRKGEGGE